MDVLRSDRAEHEFAWSYWPSSPNSHQLPDVDALVKRTCQPELEDPSTIAWGLVQCERLKEHTATVDVLEVEGKEVRWKSAVGDDELENISSKTSEPGKGKDQGRILRVFFINTLQARAGWLPGNFAFRPRTLRILQSAGLSGTILCDIFSSDGIWANMANQCFTHNSENGCLSSFEVCYRYVCSWGTGKCYTQFLRTRHQTTYFSINYPSRALECLKVYLAQNPGLAYRDFFLDALAMDVSLKLWQANISEQRETLRHHEKIYYGEDSEFKAATYQLHKLSYGWHTLIQDCGEQLAQLEFMLRTHKKYIASLQDPKNGWEIDKFHDMSETFEALKSTCENCTRWASVYCERTNIRINLLFHLAAQNESRTSTQIAASTAKVAEQTQRDSASMITIAAVTMFFLPGTFIAAVLSTTFFEYGENNLEVSKGWWILPASMIPMTVGVFAVWVGWRWWKIRRQQERVNGAEREKVD